MTIRGGEAVMQMDNATPPVYPVKSKARWLIMNSLAELDQDGEYVIDRDNGAVFAMLPATTNSGLWLSLGRNVVTINNASNITLLGLRIEYATGIGLVVADSRDITLDNLVARNHGGVAVSMEDVTSATLRGSSVGNAGCNAVRVSSGDQKTLRPGGTLIHGNNISRMGLFKRMYAGAGLRFSGVNNTFTSNTFEHGPHSGMLGGKANDCLFRDNTFQHLCEESGDSGGEYSNGLPPLCRLTQTVAVNSVLFWTQLDRPWQRDPLELVSPRAAPRPAAAAPGAQRQRNSFRRSDVRISRGGQHFL